MSLLDRVCDIVSRRHVHLVTSKSPILCSSSHFPARYSFTESHFPPWEKSQAEKFSLGTELWHSGGRLTFLKWNCFAYAMQCVQFEFLFVLFQWCAGTSPLDSWTSTKTLCLSTGNCLNQCSPGTVPGPWPRRAGIGSQATLGYTARIEFHMPVTLHRDVWLLPGPWAYGTDDITKGKLSCD